MREYNYFTYIMASVSGTVYIGMTGNIKKRVYEHKEGLVDGFTKEYECKKLVYYEHFTDVYAAIKREKELKKWRREKKENLIKTMNPHWNDLFESLF